MVFPCLSLIPLHDCPIGNLMFQAQRPYSPRCACRAQITSVVRHQAAVCLTRQNSRSAVCQASGTSTSEIFSSPKGGAVVQTAEPYITHSWEWRRHKCCYAVAGCEQRMRACLSLSCIFIIVSGCSERWLVHVQVDLLSSWCMGLGPALDIIERTYLH